MLKLKNTLNTLFILIFATSCALKPVERKVEPASTPVVEEAEPIVERTPLEAKALEAAEVAQKEDDENRIIGSSQLQKPLSHHHKSYFLYGAEHLNLENLYFDIPVVYNDAVKKWMKYFLGRGRGFFERYGARAGRYAPLLGKILEEHGLPRDLIFLAMAESGFQNKAKSWAKAVGPWQFMPATGRRYGLDINWYRDERRDPIKASIAASRYLTKLYNDFGSWELAAAAYNAGEGKVSRAISRYKTENFWKLRKGRYLKSETKNYVPKIMALAIIGKNLNSFGFEDIDFYEPLDFEEITIKPATDLIVLAERMGIEFEEIQRLNPEILRWFSPPDIAEYKLRVPVGYREQWANCCDGEEDYPYAVSFKDYRIRGKNNRLSDVARKFKIKDKKVLEWLNDKPAHARLKRGEMITLPFRKGQSNKAPMYADLYEKPRKSVIRRRVYRKQIRRALARGSKIVAPKRFYTVKRGDSLWSVAQKTGTSLDTLIVSNYHIIKHRMIRAGDRLAVQ